MTKMYVCLADNLFKILLKSSFLFLFNNIN